MFLIFIDLPGDRRILKQFGTWIKVGDQRPRILKQGRE